MTDTISREEAQDLVQAIAAQRDAHANNEAQLGAALAKANRRIAELEAQLAARPGNIVDINPQAEAA
jgi:hypothetical protein